MESLQWLVLLIFVISWKCKHTADYIVHYDALYGHQRTRITTANIYWGRRKKFTVADNAHTYLHSTICFPPILLRPKIFIFNPCFRLLAFELLAFIHSRSKRIFTSSGNVLLIRMCLVSTWHSARCLIWWSPSQGIRQKCCQIEVNVCRRLGLWPADAQTTKALQLYKNHRRIKPSILDTKCELTDFCQSFLGGLPLWRNARCLRHVVWMGQKAGVYRFTSRRDHCYSRIKCIWLIFI